MALTPARAVALAVVLCAGAVALLLPPQPRRLERGGPHPRGARDVVGRELNMTRHAVAIRMLRDSARAVAAAGPATPVTTLFVGSWTPGEITWLEQRITDITGGHVGAGRAAAVFARDSIFRGFPGLYFALPDSGGTACVALYAQGVMPPGPWMRPPPHRRVAPGLLGPCAYYARFGAPGTAVGEWLRRGGAALALTSPGYPPPAWNPPPPPPWLVRLTEGAENWLVEPRLSFPLALDACLAGQRARCDEFVQSRLAPNRELARLGIVEEFVWAVRADDAAFLSDILVAFGPERFARFWEAGGSLPEAFASAFGVPLAEWTSTWATERFGPARKPTQVGVGSVAVSLGAAAGFLALAVVIASRRRVGG